MHKATISKTSWSMIESYLLVIILVKGESFSRPSYDWLISTNHDTQPFIRIFLVQVPMNYVTSGSHQSSTRQLPKFICLMIWNILLPDIQLPRYCKHQNLADPSTKSSIFEHVTHSYLYYRLRLTCGHGWTDRTQKKFQPSFDGRCTRGYDLKEAKVMLVEEIIDEEIYAKCGLSKQNDLRGDKVHGAHFSSTTHESGANNVFGMNHVMGSMI